MLLVEFEIKILNFRADVSLNLFFDVCRTDDGKISVKAFLDELQKFGIQRDDPRLGSMMTLLQRFSNRPNSLTNINSVKLDPTAFKTILSENIVQVTKAINNSFVIPDFESFASKLEEIYNEVTFRKPSPIISHS